MTELLAAIGRIDGTAGSAATSKDLDDAPHRRTGPKWDEGV